MELLRIVESIQKGIGDTLGFLVLILGFGAMLGKLVADNWSSSKNYFSTYFKFWY